MIPSLAAAQPKVQAPERVGIADAIRGEERGEAEPASAQQAGAEQSSAKQPSKVQAVADPNPVDSLAEVEALVRKVARESFPELEDAQIEVVEFQGNPAVGFTSNFSVGSLARAKSKRRYKINVNRAVYKDPPPRAAVEAILAHELAHTAHYHSRGAGGLIGLSRIFVSRKHMACFERATDLVAISKGYAQGIKLYRAWIYARIQGKELRKKKRNYLSPAEIDFVVATLARAPEHLKVWLEHPPRDLAEFKRSAPKPDRRAARR